VGSDNQGEGHVLSLLDTRGRGGGDLILIGSGGSVEQVGLGDVDPAAVQPKSAEDEQNCSEHVFQGVAATPEEE